VQQYLSLSRLCQRLLRCEYQIGDWATLLDPFDAARCGLANAFGEARHVNSTGFAAATHVREYERDIRFRTSLSVKRLRTRRLPRHVAYG
jgi:hypothetical protein